jgi:hypothetical protein
MTDGTRHASFSPADPGTAFEPAPDRAPHGAPDRADQIGRELGIDPAGLADDDLLRELASLHRTRLETLRHGPEAALATHLRRTADLETEYLVRHPGREVDPTRLTQHF